MIDPSQVAVDVIEKDAVAKTWLSQHHYLGGNIPPSRLCVGLFRNAAAGRSELAGVAVFSIAINHAAAIPLHTGMPQEAGVDLGRFALLDDVAGNGETWMLARAFKLLRTERPQIEAVTAYSDPTPRKGPTGSVVGHVGLVYQAANARSRGQSRPRTEYFTPDGLSFSERSICKIRKRESGWRYAVEELRRRGAPAPANDDLRTWFNDLVATGFIGRRRRAGLHIYAFPLTRAAYAAGANLTVTPAPKRDPNPTGSDVTALPLFRSL